MKNRHRISRRVLRQFLHLAAVSFAIGANVTPASADSDDPAPAEQFEEGTRGDDAGERTLRRGYQHSFVLPARGSRRTDEQIRARIRVLDAGGRDRLLLALDGPSMVGPFGDGAYTILIKLDGLTERHQVRIGPGTLPYLYFTESVRA
jgi:hypothetical protein